MTDHPPTPAMPTIAIHQLHLATVRTPRKLDVFAYLIRHPDGSFLVDTGIGTGNAMVDDKFNPVLWSLPEVLAAFGLGLRDISAVINSHLHFDHCGNNQLFAGIPTYVQQRELEAAQAPSYTVREWFAFNGARIEAIDGDSRLAPGVKLVATPGHTPGHQSVLIETNGKLTLIAAQAASSTNEFEDGGNVAEAHSGLEEIYLATIETLRALRPVEVYFSHDRNPWR